MSGDKNDRNYDDLLEGEGGELVDADGVGPGAETGTEEKAEETPEEALQRLSGENEELSNRLLYLHAELDNFRKRTAKEKEQLIAFGNERLIRELIPVLDNLELGMMHGKENEGSNQLLSGVELTYNEFLKILRKFGVEQLDAKGDTFDPNIHEAMSSVSLPGEEPGTVHEVIRKGYTLNGRLLRPVQVIVVSEPDPVEGEENDSLGQDEE